MYKGGDRVYESKDSLLNIFNRMGGGYYLKTEAKHTVRLSNPAAHGISLYIKFIV
jgi:hypothetical protein